MPQWEPTTRRPSWSKWLAPDDLLGKWQNEEKKTATIEAIQNLPERERTAIALYYLHEPLKEVGQVLSVTESRTCQLCSQGVKRLRMRLKSFAN